MRLYGSCFVVDPCTLIIGTLVYLLPVDCGMEIRKDDATSLRVITPLSVMMDCYHPLCVCVGYYTTDTVPSSQLLS